VVGAAFGNGEIEPDITQETQARAHIAEAARTFQNRFLEFLPYWTRLLHKDGARISQLRDSAEFQEFLYRKFLHLMENRIEPSLDGSVPLGFTRSNTQLFKELMGLEREQRLYLQTIASDITVWRKNFSELLAVHGSKHAVHKELEQIQNWQQMLGQCAELNFNHQTEELITILETLITTRASTQQ
jgi:hypothetical protein